MQLVYDVLFVIVLGVMLLKMNAMAREITRLKGSGTPTDAELDDIRRREIAAGIREPDDEKPVTEKPNLKCPCGHGVMHHKRRRGGGCTVAINKSGTQGCACEWGQADVMDYLRKRGVWA